MSQVFRIGFSLLPFTAGLFLLSGSISCHNASMSAQDWPATTGAVKVVKSSGYWKFRDRRLAYVYAVAGTSYKGNQIAFGGGSARDYDQDTDVSVYYNPEQPSESVLEVGFLWSYVFKGVIGLALMAAGYAIYGRLR